jgi:hypothetical protein
VHADINQLGHGDFSRESALWFVVAVLGRHFNVFSELIADENQVQARRSNDNL